MKARSSTIGRRREWKVFSYLSSRGYLVLRSYRSEGPFDLVAMRPSPRETLLIQVTSVAFKYATAHYEKKPDMYATISSLFGDPCKVQLWCMDPIEPTEIHSWKDGVKLETERIDAKTIDCDSLLAAANDGPSTTAWDALALLGVDWRQIAFGKKE
jgi:hypothetical protein